MATEAHALIVSDFRDNAAEHRYEFDAPEGQSFADYRDIAGVRVILHVETPLESRGKGYASQLMKRVVEEARSANRRLRASCAFAVAYFRRHPDTAERLGLALGIPSAIGVAGVLFAGFTVPAMTGLYGLSIAAGLAVTMWPRAPTWLALPPPAHPPEHAVAIEVPLAAAS